MIALNGTFALILYSFVLGMFWPARKTMSVAEYFANIYAKSLWLSFILVIITYVFGIGDLSLVLFFAVVIKLMLDKKNSIFISLEHGPIYLFSFLLVAITFSYSSYLILKDYDTVFVQWDAVVSWNRWAVELSENQYQPQNAAYPILFPGLWSLIYKAQSDSTIWFIAKFSLFFIFLFAALIIIYLIESNELLLSLLSLVFLSVFFVDIHPFYGLLSGYMDAPVAVLVFLSAIILLLFTINIADSKVQRSSVILEFGSILVALATITKQAGLILLLPLFYVFAESLFRGFFAYWKVIYLCLVSVLPFFLFLLVLYYSGASFMGNINHLTDLTLSQSSTEGLYWNAFGKLSSSFSEIVFYAILFLSFMNVFFIKNFQGRFGIILLLTAITGFFIYANCCAYDARNGWWLISLLAVSSFAFLHNIIRDADLYRFIPSTFFVKKSIQISGSRINVFILLFALLGPILVYVMIDDAKSRTIQYENQMFIGDYRINRSVERNISLLDHDGIYLFDEVYHMRSWIPVADFDEKYRDCSSFAGNFKQCLEYYKSLNVDLLVNLDSDTYHKFSQLFDGFDLIESNSSFSVYALFR